MLELEDLDVETRAEIAERYVGYRSYPAIDPVIMQVMPLPAQQHRDAALRCCCACALELGMHRDVEPSLPKPCVPCARLTSAAVARAEHPGDGHCAQRQHASAGCARSTWQSAPRARAPAPPGHAGVAARTQCASVNCFNRA